MGTFNNKRQNGSFVLVGTTTLSHGHRFSKIRSPLELASIFVIHQVPHLWSVLGL
jgi:hypothetical protein